MHLKIKPFLVVGSSYLLGGMFLLAALAKIATLKSFAAFIAGLRFMRPEIAIIVVVLLPAVEFALGVSYFQRRVPGHVRVVALVLLAVFLVFQCAVAIPALGVQVSTCHCFGDIMQMTDPVPLIARAAGLLALNLANMWWGRSGPAAAGGLAQE